jgi:DNA-binding protein, YbaB/EbfC family
MKARLPKGVGGGPQNQNALIRQAQKMQEDIAELRANLDEREYDISAGGGVVKVKINGKNEILSIDIDPEIVDPDDIETLSDILVAAVNEAIKKVEETSNAEMEKVTGSMSFPGIPGLF